MEINCVPASRNPTNGGGNIMNSVVRENKSGLVMVFIVEQLPPQEHLIADLRPMKWTDEKHGLYLNSMEASFVHQLHNSIDILGWTSHKNPISQHHPSAQKHTSKHNSFGQFKVFREGWKGNIKFSKDEAELNNGDESGVDQITSNPWICRYRSECRQHTRRPAVLREDLAKADEFRASGFYARHSVSNRASSDPSLEVTDQNFIDEDTKDDTECEIQSSKRIKTEESSNED